MEIVPGLFLGSSLFAASKDALKEKQIKYIVNVAQEIECFHKVHFFCVKLLFYFCDVSGSVILTQKLGIPNSSDPSNFSCLLVTL